jgi:hypothetical protein
VDAHGRVAQHGLDTSGGYDDLVVDSILSLISIDANFVYIFKQSKKCILKYPSIFEVILVENTKSIKISLI